MPARAPRRSDTWRIEMKCAYPGSRKLRAAVLHSNLTFIKSLQQVVRLKTRDSDGAPVCARDEPSRRTMISAKMSGAPAVVGCSMTCTGDYQCRHFNYVPTDQQHPCHLYYYRPTQFDVQPNCRHYHTPGELKLSVLYIKFIGVGDGRGRGGGTCPPPLKFGKNIFRQL